MSKANIKRSRKRRKQRAPAPAFRHFPDFIRGALRDLQAVTATPGEYVSRSWWYSTTPLGIPPMPQGGYGPPCCTCGRLQHVDGGMIAAWDCASLTCGRGQRGRAYGWRGVFGSTGT